MAGYHIITAEIRLIKSKEAFFTAARPATLPSTTKTKNQIHETDAQAIPNLSDHEGLDPNPVVYVGVKFQFEQKSRQNQVDFL
ncbi:hypothetical protein AYW79_13725 [Ferroacidibacillus organovorans]|uniref:Uncharacterized protein n=1 Tax=Ferroacidibacillus organovorans TaxID=1765683 RepID=A0A853K9Q7_9BACL|nr:hypothetical protein AYJ22_14345 [Ferroacidibacillus organovorans]OAG91385.1 hypothetical protein AYW79_13725 [Ferroacidibacillus organovorans]